MSAPFVAMSVSVVFSAHWVQVSSSSSRRRCAACFSRQSFPSISIRPAPPKRLLNLACSAKQDTIDKVCGIVKKQLAVAQDTLVNGDTKFADLGADSLDTHYSTRQKNGWLYTCSFYSHRLCSPALFDEATSPCSFHGMTAVHCIV
ncbi:acyl carrier protein 1, chloroplastic-like [Hordeum vulgare subsp. vulgare]|uniref:acyl carrier protein 1, chloroplastic-like n=1 Tax=Hordeum vulgare subsp. vulgare TaxID=112509 RepID=UPI000B474092|nr:acyl carrier protein 1, chloroplastic-like [Hordeum vulgare subsp. vulgare]